MPTRLDGSLLRERPRFYLPLMVLADSDAAGERLQHHAAQFVGEDWRSYLGCAQPDEAAKALKAMESNLPLDTMRLKQHDAWCVWWCQVEAINTTLSAINSLEGAAKTAVFLHVILLKTGCALDDEGNGSLQVCKAFESIRAEGRECICLAIPAVDNGEPASARERIAIGCAALVLAAWRRFCLEPDQGAREAFHLSASADFHVLGFGQFDWGREHQEAVLASRLAPALRSRWMERFAGTLPKIAMPEPRVFLHEMLPQPQMPTCDALTDPGGTEIIISPDVTTVSFSEKLPPLPKYRLLTPRQTLLEHLRALVRHQYRCQLGYLPQLLRLLAVRMTSLKERLETPLMDAVSPLPETPAALFQYLKERLNAAQRAILPWKEASVQSRGDAASESYVNALRQKIDDMPSLGGGNVRVILLAAAILTAAAASGAMFPPFPAWDSDTGTYAWSGILGSIVVLAACAFAFYAHRLFHIWRSFEQLAEAIPVRITDDVAAQLIGNVVGLSESLWDQLQKQEISLEKKRGLTGAMEVKWDVPAVAGGSHAPRNFVDEAFSQEKIQSLLDVAHRYWVADVGDLSTFLSKDEPALKTHLKTACLKTAAEAINSLSFDDVASAAQWNEVERNNLIQRAIESSKVIPRCGHVPASCLCTVADSWREKHGGEYQALLWCHELPLPEFIAVSLMSVTAADVPASSPKSL